MNAPSRASWCEHGSALIATLGATAVLLPLAALAALVTRATFYMHHNTRAQAEVFYAAEAGLAHALSEVPPSMTFDQLVNGPDGRRGTTDDGTFPFRDGAPGFFPHPPLHYQVRVEIVNSNLLRLTATADGVRNSRAVIEGLVGRDPRAYVPAGVYADDIGSIAVGSDCSVSGVDQDTGDALPGIGVSGTDRAAAVLRQLNSTEQARVAGQGGTSSVSDVDPPNVRTLADALATLATMYTSTAALVGSVQLGTAAAPQITIITDAGEISGPVTGVGVLIAPAGFHVRGDLTFRGLVLADGQAVFDSGSHVAITGSLWLSGTNAILNLGGMSTITYNRSAMATVDQRWSGRLPHAIVLKGWREVL